MNPFIKVTNIKGDDVYLNINHIVLFQKKKQGYEIIYRDGLIAQNPIVINDIDLLLEKIEKVTVPRKCHLRDYPELIFTFHKFMNGDGRNFKAIIEGANGIIYEAKFNDIIFDNG